MNYRNNLQRFKIAQGNGQYEKALAEIKRGRKESCWMWYIFPQLEFQRCSEISKHYAIRGLKEAKAYLKDPILGKRLSEITKALLELESDNATEIMGMPDDMKLKSSMTLFQMAGPRHPEFEQVLEKFFGGEKDKKTLDILKMNR